MKEVSTGSPIDRRLMKVRTTRITCLRRWIKEVVSTKDTVKYIAIEKPKKLTAIPAKKKSRFLLDNNDIILLRSEKRLRVMSSPCSSITF
jgi:hypothetical protein